MTDEKPPSSPSSGAMQETKSAPAGAKPGFTTTEFYTGGAVIAGAMTIAVQDASPWVRGAAVIAAAATAIAYTVGRGCAKAQAVTMESTQWRE